MREPAAPCPKCHCVESLVVRHLADLSQFEGSLRFANVREIALVHHPVATPGLTPPVISVGQLCATVCRGCGFTELYTRGAEMIPVDGDRVVLLESQPAAPPYR